MRSIIYSRYDKDKNYLNLDSIVDESVFRANDIRKIDYPSRIGAVLCKLIGEICPDVATISMASNYISNLSALSTLSRWAPCVSALSFKDNKLSSYSSIEGIGGKDFSNLREVLFIGNYVREKNESKLTTMFAYKSNIKRIFPTVQVIDMEPVIEEISFDLGTKESQDEIPVRPGLIDSAETAQIVQTFLVSFFQLFDCSRAGLSSIYHKNAQFSLMTNTRVLGPVRDRHLDGWRWFNRDHSKVVNLGSSRCVFPKYQTKTPFHKNRKTHIVTK